MTKNTFPRNALEKGQQTAYNTDGYTFECACPNRL